MFHVISQLNKNSGQMRFLLPNDGCATDVKIFSKCEADLTVVDLCHGIFTIHTLCYVAILTCELLNLNVSGEFLLT